MKALLIVAGTSLVLLGACRGKPESAPPPPAVASSVAPAASASASAPVLAVAGTWRGSYEFSPLPLAPGASVPPPVPSARANKGTLEFHVDARGGVTGRVEAPLGPAELRGSWADERLRIVLVPTGDAGHSGTATLTVAGDQAVGELRLANPTAPSPAAGVLSLQRSK